MRSKAKIFTKLFITYLISSFAAFLLFTAVFYFLFQSDLKQNFLGTLDAQKEQVELVLDIAYKEGLTKESITSLLSISNEQDHRSIFLYDKSGQLKYKFTTLEETIYIDNLVIEEALKGKRVINFIKDRENPIFLLAAPIKSKLNNYEEQAMVIALHGYASVINEVKGLFILAGLITIFVTAIFLYILSKKITAPLREMNLIAMEYAKGNFDQKVDVKSHDEIGQLGETFNYMANELASLDSMRKEFVANVSHDMRSPLTSINGFVGALLDGTIPESQQKKYLHLMKDETERLIRLVNDLLDIARIEAGQVSVYPINYNLTEQIRKLIAKMEPEIAKQNIMVDLVTNLEEDISVYADPNRMEQVFGNLLQNAVNFSPQNETVVLSLMKTEKEVSVTIKDNGTGINREELKFIWERFFKVDKARSKKVGTGIGLSIVKHIIDLHEAKIEVESEVGTGTTFIVTLPRATYED